MITEKLKKQQLALRIEQSIYESIKNISIENRKSLNRLVIESIKKYLIDRTQDSKRITVVQNDEKKLIEYRVRFTESEAMVLKKYAKENSWSIPKEIQYRVMGTMLETGKISPEELEVIRGIRVSINALGNNINRIIREDRMVNQSDREACTILSNNITKAKVLIMKIVEKSRKRFLLKKAK